MKPNKIEPSMSATANKAYPPKSPFTNFIIIVGIRCNNPEEKGDFWSVNQNVGKSNFLFFSIGINSDDCFIARQVRQISMFNQL